MGSDRVERRGHHLRRAIAMSGLLVVVQPDFNDDRILDAIDVVAYSFCIIIYRLCWTGWPSTDSVDQPFAQDLVLVVVNYRGSSGAPGLYQLALLLRPDFIFATCDNGQGVFSFVQVKAMKDQQARNTAQGRG